MIFGPYALAAKLIAAALLLAGAYAVGRDHGGDAVQAKWDKATIERQALDIASAEERTAAVVDEVHNSNARASAELAEALKASEERQAARVRAAARAGALEGSTRAPGPYQDCRLGEAERKILEEALK